MIWLPVVTFVKWLWNRFSSLRHDQNIWVSQQWAREHLSHVSGMCGSNLASVELLLCTVRTILNWMIGHFVQDLISDKFQGLLSSAMIMSPYRKEVIWKRNMPPCNFCHQESFLIPEEGWASVNKGAFDVKRCQTWNLMVTWVEGGAQLRDRPCLSQRENLASVLAGCNSSLNHNQSLYQVVNEEPAPATAS